MLARRKWIGNDALRRLYYSRLPVSYGTWPGTANRNGIVIIILRANLSNIVWKSQKWLFSVIKIRCTNKCWVHVSDKIQVLSGRWLCSFLCFISVVAINSYPPKILRYRFRQFNWKQHIHHHICSRVGSNQTKKKYDLNQQKTKTWKLFSVEMYLFNLWMACLMTWQSRSARYGTESRFEDTSFAVCMRW